MGKNSERLQNSLQDTQQKKITSHEFDAARTSPRKLETLFKEVEGQKDVHKEIQRGKKFGQKPEMMGRILKHLDPTFSGSELITLADEAYSLHSKVLKEIKKTQFPGKEEILERLTAQKSALDDLNEATRAITGNFQNFQGVARANFEALDGWAANKYKDDSQTQYYNDKVKKGGNFFQNAPSDSGNLMLGVDLGNMTSPVLDKYTFSKDSDTLRPVAPLGQGRGTKRTNDSEISSKPSDNHALQSNSEQTDISDNPTSSHVLHTVASFDSFGSIRSNDSMLDRPASYLEKDLQKNLQEELVRTEKEIIDLRSKKQSPSGLFQRLKQSVKTENVNTLSKLLDDPLQRLQRVHDLPEIHLSPEEMQKVVADARARVAHKALQSLGKHLVSSVYKDSWDDPQKQQFVDEIQETHHEMKDYIQQMHSYAEKVEKNVKTTEKAPHPAEVKLAINDYKKACQDFSYFVVENLNAAQNRANVFIGGTEREKTFAMVQESYEANSSVGNFLQAELKTTINNIVSTVIGKAI